MPMHFKILDLINTLLFYKSPRNSYLLMNTFQWLLLPLFLLHEKKSISFWSFHEYRKLSGWWLFLREGLRVGFVVIFSCSSRILSFKDVFHSKQYVSLKQLSFRVWQDFKCFISSSIKLPAKLRLIPFCHSSLLTCTCMFSSKMH